MYDTLDGRTLILVDPATPHAWKAPRFYSTIKQVAVRRLEFEGRITTVRIGERLIVILPDRDEELRLPSNKPFSVVTRREGNRFTYNIKVDGG
jgi:hypothetical protein